jgi:hypothetical protein
VFFHEDLLYLIDDPCEDLREKIDISLRRLRYLERLYKRSTVLARKAKREAQQAEETGNKTRS